jgi:Galactose oxidase, central domain
MLSALCALSLLDGTISLAKSPIFSHGNTDARDGTEKTIAAASTTTWLPLFSASASLPSPRSYLAMTYDAASQRILLFGGYDGTGYLNDTWVFDGRTWRKVQTQVAPSRRANAQMAYDVATQRVVLFGGYDGTHYLGDTWIWDGSTFAWTHAIPAHSPPAVTGPMLFQDPIGRVDEFGGFDGHFYQGMMWQWNGADWTRLTPVMVPYARSSAAVGLNPLRDQVVLFGGLADVNPNNTWTYDGTNWTMQNLSIQPQLVYASSAAFDLNLNAVILFGGGSGGVDQDTTWAWTGSSWQQLFPIHRPTPREGAGMAYDEVLGHIILFGGQNNNTLFNDTWELTP